MYAIYADCDFHSSGIKNSILFYSNCSGERSFSELKLIFNRLRMSMTHSRMKRLVLMSVECDLLRKIDFSELILDFANRKIRKVAVADV